MPRNTIVVEAIRLAYEKGYRVMDVGVVSPKGKRRKLRLSRGTKGRVRYLEFNVKDARGKSVPIPVHRLVAFEKFGEASFGKGTLVRHLDQNPLNNSLDNIALGSNSDNMMDRPYCDRVAHAKVAASALRKLTPDALAKLRRDREGGATYRQLKDKYNISISSISRIINGTLYV